LEKKMQKKNPVIAAVLSLLLGPLGYFYIGWRYAVMAILIFLLYGIVPALAGFELPMWMQYLILPVLAWKAYTICSVRNALIESADPQARALDSFPVAAMTLSDLLVGMGMVTAGALGVYASGLMFLDGQVLRSLGLLLIGTPVLVCLATLVFGFIAAGIDLMFVRGAENVFRRQS
jgi:hypothetical protein